MTVDASRPQLVERWYAAGLYGTTTIGDEIRRASADGEIVFSSDEGEEHWAVADIRTRAEATATGLTDLGLVPGDVVALQLPTTPSSMTLMAAVWLAGGVVLPIVDIYGRHELTHILRESGARLLAVPSEWRGRRYAAEAVEWFGGDRSVNLAAIIAVGDDVPAGAIDWRTLDRGSSPHEVHTRMADDVALLVYTSGTTSEPKGVQHTHNSFLACGFREPDTGEAPPTTLGTFPAGHIAGVLAAVRPLLRGGTTVIMDRWSAKRAARLVERYGVVSSAGTPFYLATLLNEAEEAAIDVSSLQAFLTGAAAVPPALLERATRAGILSWRSYGSTEHPMISGGSPLHTAEQRHRTDGVVMPGVEIRLLDSGGAEVPVGVDGEIVVRGPKQFVGYRDEALDTDAFLPGGWFRTGDIGRLDADGHLTITDRLKDVIIRGGENVSSKEVEDLVMRLAQVSEVAVCSVPDPLFGEAVCAVAILRPGASLELVDVERHFADLGVARQKTPTRLEIVDDFPRTASGKVRKVDLRRTLSS